MTRARSSRTIQVSRQTFILGFVPDLGHDIGMRYALPAGIAALLRYSENFEVSLDELRKAGEYSIYGWTVEPA